MKTQYIHNMTRFNIWNYFLSYKYLTHFLWTKRYVSTNASVTGFHHFSLYVTELTHQKVQRVQFWSFTVALNVLRYKLWSILIKQSMTQTWTLKCHTRHCDHGCVVGRACFSDITEQNTVYHGYQAGGLWEIQNSPYNLLLKIQSAI